MDDEAIRTFERARRAALRPADPLVSCVLPAYNEAENVVPMLKELHALLCGLSLRHELIVVDDGSSDGTASRVLEGAAGMPVTLVRLSRNFGKEIALTAGIDHLRGDVAVLLDCDFQHPPERIPEFLARWREGYDMVYGMRADRSDEGLLKRLAARLFYALLNLGSLRRIPEGSQDFRVLDACVVEALRRMPERNRFMKGLFNWVGFPALAVPLPTMPRRGGRSSYGFPSLLLLALTALTAFSNMPLRVFTLAGAAVSLLSIGYALVVVVDTILFGNPVSGWPTLVVAIFFLGGVQLLSIGVLGEYIGRIFEEVKMRPIYLVSEVARLGDGAAGTPAPPGIGGTRPSA